jgi:hypothetical protein
MSTPVSSTSTPSAPAEGADAIRGARDLLRHTVATLAYRGAKAVAGAPKGFGDFRIGDATRAPVEILSHICDLLDWARALAEGHHRWNPVAPGAWDDVVARFFAALATLEEYLASDRPLGWSAERLFQGPVADALTHVGQLTMLRRLAGSPVRGENYAKAEIMAGRVGVSQAAPKVEFD